MAFPIAIVGVVGAVGVVTGIVGGVIHSDHSDYSDYAYKQQKEKEEKEREFKQSLKNKEEELKQSFKKVIVMLEKEADKPGIENLDSIEKALDNTSEDDIINLLANFDPETKGKINGKVDETIEAFEHKIEEINKLIEQITKINLT
jgi:hypothetical protein